jgi:hypothetical protein
MPFIYELIVKWKMDNKVNGVLGGTKRRRISKAFFASVSALCPTWIRLRIVLACGSRFFNLRRSRVRVLLFGFYFVLLPILLARLAAEMIIKSPSKSKGACPLESEDSPNHW